MFYVITQFSIKIYPRNSFRILVGCELSNVNSVKIDQVSHHPNDIDTRGKHVFLSFSFYLYQPSGKQRKERGKNNCEQRNTNGRKGKVNEEC